MPERSPDRPSHRFVSRFARRIACRASGRRARRALAVLAPVAGLTVALALAGCGSQGAAPTSSGRIRVLAAESFWGSIASQLGGSRVDVQSIIVNPDTDPHSYEPTAEDAREIAESQMTIVNGIGYDEWASHLLAADSPEGREVLNVGQALGLSSGDNPHQWYSPASVKRVTAAIVADYRKLDPSAASYFAKRRETFERSGLARYHALIDEIRSRYAGVPVGYSESIFQPLGRSLRLKLLTPRSFAKAIAEGSEVTAADRRTVDSQARQRKIAVWVFNSQNVTPDVKRVNEIARSAGIPIVTVTETLQPASDSFQQWQVSQLQRLRQALHQATGR